MKLILVLFLVLDAYLVNCSCPTIIRRSEWGASPPKHNPIHINTAPYVVIHHSDGSSCNSLQSCKRQVKNIQDYHMRNRKWADIGYNFLIGGDGNVYEGRGWGKQGAHVPSYNSRSIGICVIGNFMNAPPSNVQLNVLKDLISCAQTNNRITSNYNLIGHRQGGKTSCPGDKLFSEISTWPHFNPHPS